VAFVPGALAFGAESGDAFEGAPELESEPADSFDGTVCSGCGGLSGSSAAKSWI
jgi:hypothetical protein